MKDPLTVQIFESEKQHDHVGFDVGGGEKKISIVDNILEESDGREDFIDRLVTSRSVLMNSKTRQMLGLLEPCSPNVSSNLTEERSEEILGKSHYFDDIGMFHFLEKLDFSQRSEIDPVRRFLSTADLNLLHCHIVIRSRVLRFVHNGVLVHRNNGHFSCGAFLSTCPSPSTFMKLYRRIFADIC